MADEPGIEIRPAPPTVHFEHYCQHPRCKTWGFFGYDNRMAKTTDWFCGDHRPDKNDQVNEYDGGRPNTADVSFLNDVQPSRRKIGR